MSLGLSAPASVPVELRAADSRLFRLSSEIGEGGIAFVEPAPFEPGRPLTVRFTLPGGETPIELRATVVTTGDPREQQGDAGGRAAHFLEVPAETRALLLGYIVQRLGLPPLP